MTIQSTAGPRPKKKHFDRGWRRAGWQKVSSLSHSIRDPYQSTLSAIGWR
ncbi:hypothetical protein K788_0005470 [Paraburkholderia caribensis MBA4]|uniref:Uncharacterized protein n=1 Tax=Paraburkholderia caribensis MBA4 TaxID=1323664 RepID=A0A0P0RFM2_9BURK|nr:hypothetical protein K788_0005470 [Paraburkholderia caribensis MBA4]